MVGKHEEAAAYKEKYEAAYAKYKKDIKNAPENGPNIKFSDYFKV